MSIKMAEVTEQLFRFQFSASTIEFTSSSACNESHKNTTLAFRLFDFPSVLLHLQRAPVNAEELLVECPPKRSGIERWRVRGGKSCVFSMPNEQLKSLSETSLLYVMLTRSDSVSSCGRQGVGGQLVAASAVSLRGLVETCLACPAPARHKHLVLLYRGSQLYAKANVKFSLQRMQETLEGENRVELIDGGATRQSRRVQGEVETHQRAETHVVCPPAMLFTAQVLKHQPKPCSGAAKTSLLSSDPVLTEGCLTTKSGHRTIWPNGYVEEVVHDEMMAIDLLPTTHEAHTDTKSPLEDRQYPILQALLKELSIINSHPHEVQFQEHEVVVAPRVSDKCLQTEEDMEVPPPRATEHAQHKMVKHGQQRPFVRTCCAMKHVPGDQKTARKKLTRTKPIQTPLQASKVFPSGSDHPPVVTVGQVETTTSVQLAASVRTPSLGGATGKAEKAEREGTTAQPIDVPTTGSTDEEASSGLKEIDTCQACGPAQESDKGDRSGDKHVEGRDDRTVSHIDSKSYRSDSHVDSKGDRSDSHVDSSGEKGHKSRSHSHVSNIRVGTQYASGHSSPESIHSNDSNTNTHKTKKHEKASERGDSAAESEELCSADGGPTTGYSVDSLEEGRSVATSTGLSSELPNSYTEDFESGSNSSQHQNPVSNSDWVQDECPSPLPVGEESVDKSLSTAAISSSISRPIAQ